MDSELVAVDVFSVDEDPDPKTSRKNEVIE